MKERRVTQGVLLFGDRLFRLLIAVLSTALIARALGPDEYGVFAQTLLALSILDIVTGMGIGGVIGARITQIAPSERLYFFCKSLGVRVLATLLFLGVGWIALEFYFGIPEEFGVALLMTASIGLLLNNWIIVEGFLNGIGFPEKAALSKSITALIAILVRYLYAQLFDASIVGFVIIFVAEQFLLTCILIYCVPLKIAKAGRKKNSFVVKDLMTYASVMWLSQLATLIYMKVDQVVLSVYASDNVVGTYMLATGLVELTYALPIIINAIFIADVGVVRAGRKTNNAELATIMIKLYRYGFYGAFFISTLLCLSSRLLIPALYGVEYLPAVDIFNWLIFSLPWVTVGSIQLLTIYTGDDPNVHLKKTITMAITSPTIAIFGWSVAGESGLGISVVMSQFIGCYFLNYFFDRHSLKYQSRAIFFLKGNRYGS